MEGSGSGIIGVLMSAFIWKVGENPMKTASIATEILCATEFRIIGDTKYKLYVAHDVTTRYKRIKRYCQKTKFSRFRIRPCVRPQAVKIKTY